MIRAFIILHLLVCIFISNCLGKTVDYYFEGTGRTRDDAVAAALRTGIDEIYGVNVYSQSVSRSDLKPQNTTILTRAAEGIRYKVTAVEFADEYKSTYRAHIKLMVRTFHPSESAWRSALVPGWGQFYKGSQEKGWVALVGTSGLLVSGILTANHSNEMSDRSNQASTQYRRNYYNDEATKYHQVSLVCYGLAAGLYALNVFDAISAPLGFKTRMVPEVGMENSRIGIRFELTFNQ